MSLPTPRKLPSGNWFCRVHVGGKYISITRQTKNECLAEAIALKDGKRQASQERGRQTVGDALDAYIAKREAARSPSTIRGYRTVREHQLQSLMDLPVSKLTDVTAQKAINAECRIHQPKTVKNAWCLIASALRESCGLQLDVVLPAVPRNQHAYLTAEQIPVFLSAIKGTPVELAALLGLHSLRRSEILDVTYGDVDLKRGNIRVSGSAVIDQDGLLQHKATCKTSNSNRTVPILIPRLRELLEQELPLHRSSDYLVTCDPCSIYKRVNTICRRNNLPEIGAHGLRHSFASLAVHTGMAPDVAMRIGGWDDVNTMKRIYTHVSEADIASAASAMAAFYQAQPE